MIYPVMFQSTLNIFCVSRCKFFFVLGMMLVLSFKRFWDHVMESVFETPYMIHLLRGTYLYFDQFLYLDHETVLLEISLPMAALKMLIISKR